jgi:hypothetical protein
MFCTHFLKIKNSLFLLTGVDKLQGLLITSSSLHVDVSFHQESALIQQLKHDFLKATYSIKQSLRKFAKSYQQSERIEAKQDQTTLTDHFAYHPSMVLLKHTNELGLRIRSSGRMYWVVGRIYEPDFECFVCYQDNNVNNLVDIAFRLTLAMCR